MDELATTKERDLHFILDDGNYDFNVKVDYCKLVSFVKDVIYCRCLRCVFCFRIKEKEKDIFYINFYSTIFPQSFFFFYYSLLKLNNYNGCLSAIYNCYFL